MCGIAGLVTARGEISRETLEKMRASLSHRGPDGSAIWVDYSEKVGLVHTRLAIIDLEGGSQPIHSFDHRFTIVLNGEIYNYRKLRLILEREGFRFSTGSDTEVVLTAYIAWGTNCLSKLHGMFAFAIYDSECEAVFVARDRTGIKPLYYFHGNGLFCFASEIKAILCEQSIPRKINMAAVADFLVFSYVSAPSTSFEEIYEVPPGSWMMVEGEVRKAGYYWQWQRDGQSLSEDDALEQTRTCLIESVEEHFVADVQIGAFLSGGIDSSLICAIATKELGRKLDTFTVGFDEASHDEAATAGKIAKYLGTRHHSIRLDKSKVSVDLICRVLNQYDQPFGDSSAIPTYLISEEIAKHVKVALSGDGGDEMFGGYRRVYYADLARGLNRLLGSSLHLGKPMLAVLGLISPNLARAGTRILNASLQLGADRLTWLSCYCPPSEVTEILTDEANSRLGQFVPALLPNDWNAEPGGGEFVDVTVGRVLAADYLRKVDIASSAHGLEVRVPFLGNQVLAHAQRLDRRLNINSRQNKILTRRLLGKYLPSSITMLPKMGFGIPLPQILSSSDKARIRDSLLTSKDLNAVIEKQFINEVTSAIESDSWSRNRYSKFIMYQRLYALLALDTWMKKWRPTF